MSGTIIAIILLVVVVGVFLVGLYFFMRKSPLSDPTDLTATPSSAADGTYDFAWTDDNPSGTKYQLKILTAAGTSVTTASITTSATVGRSWSPSTVFVNGVSMSFTVQAISSNKKLSSAIGTLNFTPGDQPKGGSGSPPADPVNPELYLVTATGGGNIFTATGSTCTADTDCAADGSMTCTVGGNCVYTDTAAITLANKVCSSLGATVGTEDAMVNEFNMGASWCSTAIYTGASGTAVYGYPSYKPGSGCGLDNLDFPHVVTGGSTLNANILCYGTKPATGTTVDVYGDGDGVVNTSWSNNLNGGNMYSKYDTIDSPPAYGCQKPGEACELDPAYKKEVFLVSPSQSGMPYIFGGANNEFSTSALSQLYCRESADCPDGSSCNTLSSKCYLPPDSDSVYRKVAVRTCAAYGAVPATSSQVQTDFKLGASWCNYGFTLDGNGTGISYGFPSWNGTVGCGASTGDVDSFKPAIVPGEAAANNNILCYGAKPASGTMVDLFKVGDKGATVVHRWSDNMDLYSKYDNWDGTYRYGCSTTADICTS